MARPALLAQTAPDAEIQTSTSVDRRVDELEKEVQKLRAEIAAMKQATPAVSVMPATLVQPQAIATTSPAGARPADPLSGIASVIGGSTITGLVDTYYTYNVNQPSTRSSGLRLFDNATNQFAFNLIELGLVKAPDPNSPLGYNLTFGYGNAMNVVNSSDPSFLQFLKEAYVSYLTPVGKRLQIDAGKFVTPNGAEVIESNANWNYSRSLLFNYAIPFYHFGLRAKYTFSDKYSLTGYVTNGWNNVVANNSGNTGGLSFAWSPSKKLSFTENWMGGPGATPIDGDNWRNLFDTVVTYSPNSKLSLMANLDYGRSEGIAGSRVPIDWSGLAGYVKYQFNPKYAIATRYEYYNDHDGVTTGGFQTINGSSVFVATPQHIHEVTGTVERRIAQHLITRVELRHDTSNQPAFLKGNTPVLGQTTVAGGLMFVLEPAR